MKICTYFGSKLGLGTVSEEPMIIPTRLITHNEYLIKNRFRIQISDFGKFKRVLSPGTSIQLVFVFHCVFGIFVM